MMVVWTEDMKAKAAATRAETKRKKEERESKKMSKLTDREVLDMLTPPELPKSMIAAPAILLASEANLQGLFDWHHAPLEQAQARLGDMKREYDRAAKIVMERQTINRPKWVCFTQLHKDIVPKSVQALCRKTGDDGRWASRDDGVFKVVDGLKVPDPQFCCSAVCHEYYLKSKPINALSRH